MITYSLAATKISISSQLSTSIKKQKYKIDKIEK
jgi:hypothetical protein